MLNVTLYKEYFLQLAKLHKVLLHEPSIPGRTAFTFFSQEEVIANELRSKIGAGPCFHLHMYEWRMTDNGAYDLRSHSNGAFMVTMQASKGALDKIELAYVTTEQIVNDMINKMLDDYSTSCSGSLPFGIPDWNQLQVTSVGPLWDNRYGWFVQLPFLKKRDARTPQQYAIAAAAAFNAPEISIFEKQFEKEFE